MGRLVLAFVAGVVALVATPLLALGGVSPPSAVAVEGIPPRYLALYQEAALQRCPTLPWSVLAAIGSIESGHGTTRGATTRPDGTVVPPIVGPTLDGSAGTRRILDTEGGRYDGDRRFDHAVGPMQFIPATWDRYGLDASGDGVSDPHNASDAVHTAAAYLCRGGGDDPARLPDALWTYNRSSAYVRDVLALASRYARGTGAIVVPSETLVAMVLANPRLTIYGAGRADVAAGRIDARVLTLLQAASQRWTLAISSLQSGHSKCVGGGDHEGCRMSDHWHGRGVDIHLVDGQPVTRSNRTAYEFVAWLLILEGDLRPHEVGHPWPALEPLPGSFSDAAHAGHVHLGWNREPSKKGSLVRGARQPHRGFFLVRSAEWPTQPIMFQLEAVDGGEQRLRICAPAARSASPATATVPAAPGKASWSTSSRSPNDPPRPPTGPCPATGKAT